MPTRTAQAEWNGSLVDGNGRIKSATGAINQASDWKSRAENGTLTNPEELIAAAHAGCFAMALSHILGEAGLKPTKINSTAKVSFEKVGDGFSITRIDLVCEGVVPGTDEANFKKHAETAKANCPVSKALAGVKTITLDAKLAK